MLFLRIVLAIVVIGAAAPAGAQTVSFRAADGHLLYGDVYGSGDRGVIILGHGGYSTRASWKPFAETLQQDGFQVLVFESRGAADLAAGRETPCLSDDVCQSKDVLAAIRYLRRLKVKTVSLIGGSLGGAAIALASIDASPQPIESLVLMAPAAVASPEKIPGRKLVITSRQDANGAGLRLPSIEAQFARMRQPKQFVLVEGSAHGQLILSSPDGAAATRDIIQFLRAGR